MMRIRYAISVPKFRVCTAEEQSHETIISFRHVIQCGIAAVQARFQKHTICRNLQGIYGSQKAVIAVSQADGGMERLR